MNNIEIKEIKILDGTNYHIWYDTIKAIATANGLEEYLTIDKIAEAESAKPLDQEKVNTAKKENGILKAIIINSVSNKIHEDIVGIDTTSVIINTLKTEYDKDTKDLTQWIKKLKSIKAKKEEEIPKAVRKILKIFKNMEDAKATMEEKEKVKYFLHILPEKYRKKLTLTNDSTVDNLQKIITEDLNMWNYIEDWDTDSENESNDDPMEIDFAGKFKKSRKNPRNNDNKNNIAGKNNNDHHKNHNGDKFTNKNNKFCEICQIKGHSTSECYYNAKNPRSNYYKYYTMDNKNQNNRKYSKNKNYQKFAGFLGHNIDLNNEYNCNINNFRIKNHKNYLSCVNSTKIECKKCQNPSKVFKGAMNLFNTNYNSKITNKYNEKTIWLYDTGAGEHITNDKSILNNFKEEKITLKCANNTFCDFEGYGDVNITINNKNINLNKVYYSKDIAKNMLSGIKLVKCGVKILIEEINNEVVLKLLDNNYKTIASFNANKNDEINITGVQNKNNINDKNNIMALNTFKDINDLIWHRRLGHFYNSDIKNYLKRHKADIKFCDDCKIAKMKRKPHNKVPPKATSILETIHSDIIGPISESLTGKRYILTFIDEFSRKSWIFLLKNKKEATDFIIDTLKYLMNIYDDKNIKYFKSDNANEYKNTKINKFCKKHGIQKVYSPPYNPENNGIAERFNQTIISCTKTLLYWSGLSENLWDYAITYANYIYNRVPHSSISNKIPDEVFFKRKIKINHLKVFGCITYYKNFEQHQRKFSPNSKKGIFLGFSEDTNCYLIMDYKNLKVYKVREIYSLEDTPADLKIANPRRNKYLGQNFLDFDFNFTNISGEDFNNLDPYSEKLNPDLNPPENDENNNEHKKENNIIIKGTLNDKTIKHKDQDNSDGGDINDNIMNENSDENENKNQNDEKIFNNKNSQNFEKIIDDKININENENNNLSSTSKTLNNNNSDSQTLINNIPDQNKFLINEDNINSSEFNSNSVDNNDNNISQYNDNILQNTNNFSSNTVLDKVLNNSIPPNVNNRRSNIKKLYIYNDTKLPENVSKIKNAITQARFKSYSNKPVTKFKNNTSINNYINKTSTKSNLKNSFNKNILNKPICKRHSFISKTYFPKHNHNSNKYFKYMGNINNIIPKSYQQALNSPFKNDWIKAINDELNNLYSNNIMTFVKHIPNNKKVISTRWVFALKTDSSGNITRYKARLVARGFSQEYGIDYNLTFSPTLNIDCLKLIFALAAKLNWSIQQLDIKAAYLNAPLDYDIYVSIPPGDTNFGRGYWKLNKSLYGLKQSGRQWYKTISQFLINNNFIQLKSESCIFIKLDKNQKLVCLIGLYVDDMAITGYIHEINNIINKIKNEFKISKSGPVDYILGIKVENNNNKYTISQISFINKILEKFNINNQRKINTPCVGDNTISENNTPFDSTKYKSAIGMLIYLAKCTRPDIAFAVNKAARNSENPTVTDWNKVINILKYLNSHKNYKITYDGQGDIIAYTDSDFAGDIKDRKSTSGNIILMGKNPICWNSKKQTIVATSTAEAEYVSASLCIKKLLWIKNILFELFHFKKPITLYTDNRASKISMENGDLNPKLKHISINYHFNKDNIEKNIIKLSYIETNKMLADILTKHVNGTKMTSFANQVFNN